MKRNYKPILKKCTTSCLKNKWKIGILWYKGNKTQMKMINFYPVVDYFPITALHADYYPFRTEWVCGTDVAVEYMMQLLPSHLQRESSWFMPRLWPISWASTVEKDCNTLSLNCKENKLLLNILTLNTLHFQASLSFSSSLDIPVFPVVPRCSGVPHVGCVVWTTCLMALL